MIGDPMPNSLAGLPFGWGAVFALLNLILGGGVFASWVRSRPKMREIQRSAEEKLRDDLIARVEKLESRLEETRTHYESKLEKLGADYEVAQRTARHELNNVKMRFRALVMLLKRLPNPPEMLVAILADIESMEAEQMHAEALEKGAVSAAKIAATNPTI